MSPTPPIPLSAAARFQGAAFWARLHLSRQLRRRRFWMWAGGLALLMTVLLGSTPISQSELAALCLFLLTPMIGLFFGVGVLRADIDDSTLTYPFTRPLGRVWIFGARFAAALALVWMLVVPMAALCAFEGDGHLIPFILAGLLGGLAYTAFFALLGVWMKWSTWVGLGWILLWEQGVSLVPGFLGRLALVTHLRAVADQPLAEHTPLTALWTPPPLSLSLAVLLAVPAVALYLAGRRVKRRAFVITR